MSRWELKLLRGLQFETVAKQPADNNEKDSGRKLAQQTPLRSSELNSFISRLLFRVHAAD